eukprot:288921_1
MASVSSVTIRNKNLYTECLVYGYIRIISIKNKIIPSSIIDLCLTFYSATLKVICVEDNGGYSSIPPQISITELDTTTNYQCYLKPINKVSFTQPINYHIGICYVENFTLPKHITFPDTISPICNIIFRTGDGSNCCAYIIDEKYGYNDGTVDTYIWKLPSPKRGAYGASTMYSTKHGLITVGNHECEAVYSSLNVLRFDENNTQNKRWQWEESAMKTKRQYPAAAMINDDIFICVGGNQNKHHLCAEIYDFNNTKWTRLNDMKHKRKCCGIYVDKNDSERIYVGGGFHSLKQFEYWVASKNEWFILPNSNKCHEVWPIIWSSNVNVINVASVKCKVFERLDLRENKWHVYVGNDSTSFNDFFGASIKASSYSRLIINECT